MLYRGVTPQPNDGLANVKETEDRGRVRDHQPNKNARFSNRQHV